MVKPYTAGDRDLLIKTVIGEAGRESATGQAAVVSVIANRAYSGRFGSGGISSVIMQPGQFSMHNDVTGYAGGAGGNSARVISGITQSQYDRTGKIVDSVMSGETKSPVGGSLNYFNPKIASPGWGRGEKWNEFGDVGNHRFGTAGGEKHYAGDNPNDPRYAITDKRGSELGGGPSGVQPTGDKYEAISDWPGIGDDAAGKRGSPTGESLQVDGTTSDGMPTTTADQSSDIATSLDDRTEKIATGVKKGEMGTASSVPIAIVTAAEQESKTAESVGKATAAATLAAAETQTKSDASLQGDEQSWLGNWIVRTMLFIVGAVFIGGALFMLGGQSILQDRK